MNTSFFQGRVASCVIGVVSLLQMSPAVASAPNTGPGMTQGSRSPGFPAPVADAEKNKHRGPVDITFTKWVTTFPRMEGFTGGDIPGDFVGEVFQRQVSLDGRVIRLEAIYEVQAGDHSFTALIRGGTGATNTSEPASVSGAALLDGVVLAGWRTGARVHVEFHTTTSCLGAPDARTCFQGTIHIERAPEE